MNTFNNQSLGDPQPQATHEVVVELHGAHLFSEGHGANEANFLFLTYKTGVMLKLGGGGKLLAHTQMRKFLIMML